MNTKDKYEQHLKNIIEFWFRARDDEEGGYHFSIDRKGTVKNLPIKPLVIQARLLYIFSEGIALGMEDAADHAEHIYKYISGILKMKSGWYYSPSIHFKMEDPERKNLYANLFVIIALARYSTATGEKKYLTEAEELLSLIESECIKGSLEENGLIGFNLFGDPKVRSYTANYPLHYLEGLGLLKQADTSLNIDSRVAGIRNFFYSTLFMAEQSITLDHFDEGWDDPQSGYGSYAYPGHSLEWIEFFRQFPGHELDCRTETALYEYVAQKCVNENGILLANYYLTEQKAGGGGLFWPQAEGIRSFYLARMLYGEQYKSLLEKLEMAYFNYFIDDDNGIFFSVGENCVVTNASKGTSWKCDYHSVRMCRGVLEYAL